MDEFFSYWYGDFPLASDLPKGKGHTTWEQNFRAFFALYRDNIIKRDMEWVKSVHPNHHTLESWMRENKYDGQLDGSVLKGYSTERASTLSYNPSIVEKL